jgi:hypothetical protein
VAVGALETHRDSEAEPTCELLGRSILCGALYRRRSCVLNCEVWRLRHGSKKIDAVGVSGSKVEQSEEREQKAASSVWYVANGQINTHTRHTPLEPTLDVADSKGHSLTSATLEQRVILCYPVQLLAMQSSKYKW